MGQKADGHSRTARPLTQRGTETNYSGGAHWLQLFIARPAPPPPPMLRRPPLLLHPCRCRPVPSLMPRPQTPSLQPTRPSRQPRPRNAPSLPQCVPAWSRQRGGAPAAKAMPTRHHHHDRVVKTLTQASTHARTRTNARVPTHLERAAVEVSLDVGDRHARLGAGNQREVDDVSSLRGDVVGLRRLRQLLGLLCSSSSSSSTAARVAPQHQQRRPPVAGAAQRRPLMMVTITHPTACDAGGRGRRRGASCKSRQARPPGEPPVSAAGTRKPVRDAPCSNHGEVTTPPSPSSSL